MKIVVVGLGYVGLSNAILLAQHNEVVGVDIMRERVDALNAKNSPIEDLEISEYLANKNLNFKATTDFKNSVRDADYVIVSTPTNFDDQKNYFDTESVKTVIEQSLFWNPRACIVVRSTIPVGFIDNIRAEFKTDTIMFSPEFLREGSALLDNLYPSRIIVGAKSNQARVFGGLLAQGALKENVDLIFTGTREAEAIKLFSNSFLAMRVAFFNELDSFALSRNLSSKEIIDGVSLDERIGNYYNNPSFGYGGYCLPKDTKQLLANFNQVPQKLIHAIVEANFTRKNFLVEQIIKRQPKIVGIFGLAMKSGSDNFRESSILDIMTNIQANGIEVLVYEPKFLEDTLLGSRVERDLNRFKLLCDTIICNRMDDALEDSKYKVFTRDIYGFC